MSSQETGHDHLAERIRAMSEVEVHNFIRHESRNGRLSKAVRTLNHDALTGDAPRREEAEAAIRKLGFI